MKKLKRKELQEIRDSLIEFLGKSVIRRGELLATGAIDEEQSNRIAKLEDDIRDIADELTRVIIKSIITDLDEPGKKIVTATNNVNEAINELENFNDLLQIMSSLLSMASTILSAFSTGNFLKLADLLEIIDGIV